MFKNLLENEFKMVQHVTKFGYKISRNQNFTKSKK